MLAVRAARAEDAEAWRSIVLEAARDAQQILTTPEEVWSEEELRARFAGASPAEKAFLVCELDGRVVGVLGLERGARVASRHTAEFGLVVARDVRGRGVGTALIGAAEATARAWGVRKLCLGVYADNTRARDLYARLGYAEEGCRREHYLVGGKLHDEVLMAKRLDGGAA